MVKPVYLFLLVNTYFLSKSAGIVISVDEARQKIDELKLSIRRQIYFVLDNVDDDIWSANNYCDKSVAAAEKSIGQEYQDLNNQLSEIQDHANSSGVDTVACLEIYQNEFHELPQESIQSLADCSLLYKDNVKYVQSSTYYTINIKINEVNVLDFQLDQCAEEEQCIVEIIKEVELKSVSIPQAIGIDLQNERIILASLKEPLQECIGGKVAHFTSQETKLFKAMTDCFVV